MNHCRQIKEHQAVEVSKQCWRFSTWLPTVCCSMPRHAAALRPWLQMERAKPLQQGAVARSRKHNCEADGSASSAARLATSSIVLQDLAPQPASKGSAGTLVSFAACMCFLRVLLLKKL